MYEYITVRVRFMPSSESLVPGNILFGSVIPGSLTVEPPTSPVDANRFKSLVTRPIGPQSFVIRPQAGKKFFMSFSGNGPFNFAAYSPGVWFVATYGCPPGILGTLIVEHRIKLHQAQLAMPQGEMIFNNGWQTQVCQVQINDWSPLLYQNLAPPFSG